MKILDAIEILNTVQKLVISNLFAHFLQLNACDTNLHGDDDDNDELGYTLADTHYMGV